MIGKTNTFISECVKNYFSVRAKGGNGRKGFAALLLLFVFFSACKKESIPDNPYKTIDTSTVVITPVEPDPNSIVGLHKNIFFPKCANPGCHDGTFEPDYRTVESTYSTLVYQPVNKVTLDSAKLFSLRVIPHNVDDSWLIERLVTQTSEYMPSNSVRLSTAEIDHVKNWINAGCPDINGTVAVKPNLQPNILGYAASDSAYNRIDTIRVNNFPLNPFILPTNIDTMLIGLVATDTSDGADATNPAQFTKKEIRFSTDKNNFSGALTLSAYYYVPQFNVWLVMVPKWHWTSGTTVYFRIYVNDGHHVTDAEFPRYESLDYYKTLYAFYVQ